METGNWRLLNDPLERFCQPMTTDKCNVPNYAREKSQMHNSFLSPRAHKKLTAFRNALRVADREWKKLLKRKGGLSTDEKQLYKSLIELRNALHRAITNMELAARPIDQILKALDVDSA